MSDATNGDEKKASEPPAAEATEEVPSKKKGQRKPIFVLVPQDIEDLEAVDVPVPTEPELDDEGKKRPVTAVRFRGSYYVYAVPAGPGQKKAVKGILKSHNVDLRNIARVRMFAGEKVFKVETQYNIRW